MQNKIRIVGNRKEPAVEFFASAKHLIQGANFNDETQKLLGMNNRFFPKGVYHYKTNEEANIHWETEIIRNIARKIKS
jgi:hypothetical protein